VTVKAEGTADLTAPVNVLLMEQALANLIDNAIKYSDENGEVIVRVEEEEGLASIAVTDDGVGIPEKDLPRIFERFYRVDKARSRELGGTGLGLAIVKHIALVHGGTVQVESELGRGSTFTIALPIGEDSAGKVS
jgi:two-component system phosphate regulon sensor histidine kinase PhoR